MRGSPRRGGHGGHAQCSGSPRRSGLVPCEWPEEGTDGRPSNSGAQRGYGLLTRAWRASALNTMPGGRPHERAHQCSTSSERIGCSTRRLGSQRAGGACWLARRGCSAGSSATAGSTVWPCPPHHVANMTYGAHASSLCEAEGCVRTLGTSTGGGAGNTHARILSRVPCFSCAKDSAAYARAPKKSSERLLNRVT